MKTCFVSRLGAYGDMMHCAHIPRLIKEHYNVDRLDFETSDRGFQILWNNPYIDNLTWVDTTKITNYDLVTRWEYQRDEYDLFFNFMHTIEMEFCTLENDQRYYRNDKYRRERLGKMSYYDVMTQACGLPESYFGTRGQLYYDDEYHEKSRAWVESVKEKYSVDWVILVCVSGSSLHKRFQQCKSICEKLLAKYENALVILTGDKDCKGDEFKHERVLSKIDKWNFRTVALMSKYVDFVISPETGLACVSHSWDTPTLQLLTAASWDNHIKYAKNAYWLQSEVYCSPCHKSPLKYYGCPTKGRLPSCVWFDEDKVMIKIEEAHSERKPVLTNV